MINDFYCCYCGIYITYTSQLYTKEHVLPKSKGGNNSNLNKLTCCKNCNNWRGNKSLASFLSDVRYHYRNNIIFKNYTLYDYSIMIENIQEVNEYFKTNKQKLKL